MVKKTQKQNAGKEISPIKLSILNALVCAVVGAVLGSILTFFITTGYNKSIAEPEIKNYKVSEIKDWYNKIANDIDAQKLAQEKYYGSYVQWEGEIEDITSNYIYDGVDVRFSDFIASFKSEKLIKDVNKNSLVVVRGQISDINENFVYLENCKIIYIRSLNNSNNISIATSDVPVFQSTAENNEEKREFVDISPRSLYDWYNGFENEIDASELAKVKYIGKYVVWEGIVHELNPSTGNEFSVSLIINGYNDKKVKNFSGSYINFPFLFIHIKDIKQSYSLVKDEKVKIIGKIFVINNAGLTLNDVTVLKK